MGEAQDRKDTTSAKIYRTSGDHRRHRDSVHTLMCNETSVRHKIAKIRPRCVDFAEEASRVAAGLNCEEDEDGTGEPIAFQQSAMSRMFFIFVMRQRHRNFACVLGEGLGLGFYKDSRWAVLRKFSHGCRQLVCQVPSRRCTSHFRRFRRKLSR